MHDPLPLKSITLFNGCRVSYLDEGEGPQTLLMIHGLANYAQSWSKNIEGLKGSYRCVALDLPGNGHSDAAKEPYTMAFFARCIIDFIGRMKLKQLTLVGHSMGGQIALKVLQEAPSCAERLILCAPAGFETFNTMDKMLYQGSLQYASWISNDESNLRHTVRNSFYRFPKGADVMIRDLLYIMHHKQARHYKTMVDQCVQAMMNEPVYPKLSQVRQPTLVLFGEQDALIPNRILHPVSTRQIAEQGVAKMPKAKLKMIPHCGHFIQWEKSDEVNTLIQSWLGVPA